MEAQASEEAGPVCRARIVKHREAGRMLPADLVELEALNGAVYVWPLSAGGFLPGDIVLVTLEQRPRPAR